MHTELQNHMRMKSVSNNEKSYSGSNERKIQPIKLIDIILILST